MTRKEFDDLIYAIKCLRKLNMIDFAEYSRVHDDLHEAFYGVALVVKD